MRFECIPAVRRTAAGRSHPRRRPATSQNSFPATLAPTLNIHSRLKWVRRPGGTTTLDAQAACYGPPWAGVRPARPKGSQKHNQQVQPCRPSGSKTAGPTATSVAGLRCGRLRPARLYEPQKHSKLFSPKLAPVLYPVFASLRLRCRSAALARGGQLAASTQPFVRALAEILFKRETRV